VDVTADGADGADGVHVATARSSVIAWSVGLAVASGNASEYGAGAAAGIN